MTSENKAKPEVFKIGYGRRIALLLVFVLMLPFFFSMPVMIFQRAMHGQYGDAAAIFGLGVVFAISLFYLALQIQAGQKTRIELSDNSARLVYPKWKGLLPMGPYSQVDVPYSDIQAVEQRGELYRGMGVIGIPKASSITTKDGERIVLGYVTENEADPAIPYNVLAEKIAQKANVQISNKGVVDAGGHIGALFSGGPSWDLETLSDDRISAIRRRTTILRWALILAFAVLMGIAAVFVYAPGVRNFIGAMSG